MRLVSYFEDRSVVLQPYNWWFAGASAALVAAIIFVAQQQALAGSLGSIAFAFLWFGLMWAWGCLCLASWFHPTKGTMRYGSRWWFGLPRPIQTFMRGYGAIFLVVWFLFSFVLLVLLSGVPLVAAGSTWVFKIPN
jgi:hypothetical protein